MPDIITSMRNADIGDIVSVLQDQRARRLDVVVTPQMIRSEGGRIVVLPGEDTQFVTGEGVTSAAGYYLPTAVGDEDLGQLLSVHAGYLKALRAEGRTDLLDANFNGKLHGAVSISELFEMSADGSVKVEPPFPPYSGGILLRLLRGDNEVDGILRAAMSPRFKIIDNLDVLLACMEGMREAGIDAVPEVSSLTERRMHIRFSVPEIAAFAPELLKGYRSPFDGPGGVQRAGQPGMKLNVGHFGMGEKALARALATAKREGQDYAPGTEPVVFAGIKITNSDVGEGACTIAPEIGIQICGNRLTITAEADRQIHLGAARDEGVVQWSAETMDRELALITSRARDAVQSFLSEEWFLGKVAEIEAKAGVPVTEHAEVIKDVSRSAGFSKGEEASILDHFLRGGSYTAGGVANAVTSVSQTLADADRAAELDARAIPAMEHAARLAAKA